MRLFFIRHSIALERYEWNKNDLLRPLSQKGKKVADNFFKKIATLYRFDAIITSKATRALETAEILMEHLEDVPLYHSSLLEPGCDFAEFKKEFASFDGSYENIAFVGHEPDFGSIISSIIAPGAPYVMLKLKKPSLAEIELLDTGMMSGELRNLISPKVLK